MSEGIIITLITMIGGIIGAIIGNSVNAYATIKAAGIKVGQTPSQEVGQIKEQKTSKLWRTIAGTLIGITVVLGAAIFINPFHLFAVSASTNSIAGNWTGILHSEDPSFSSQVELSIMADCTIGNICGTYLVPEFPCSGSLIFRAINGDTYEFIEQRSNNSEAFCDTGGHEHLRLLPSEKLAFSFNSDPSSSNRYVCNATLSRK